MLRRRDPIINNRCTTIYTVGNKMSFYLFLFIHVMLSIHFGWDRNETYIIILEKGTPFSLFCETMVIEIYEILVMKKVLHTLKTLFVLIICWFVQQGKCKSKNVSFYFLYSHSKHNMHLNLFPNEILTFWHWNILKQ